MGISPALLSILSFITPAIAFHQSLNHAAIGTRTLFPSTIEKGFHSNINTILRHASTISTEEKKVAAPKTGRISEEVKDAVIVGGGPAGLLSAIMLTQKIPCKVKVYERRSKPPSSRDESVWNDVAKFYLMGIGLRGQTALEKYGVLGDFKEVSVPVLGRKDWSPESDSEEGVERIFTDRPVNTEVLPREKLVGVLSEHIEREYAGRIEICYLHEVEPIDFGSIDDPRVTLRVSNCAPDEMKKGTSTPNTENDVTCDIDNSYNIKTDLVIGVDGTARSIANAIESHQPKSLFGNFKVKRYDDDNQRVYKSIPMKLPKDWRHDLNYSARTKDGVNMDALPADSNGNYCAVLLVKQDHPFAQANSDAKELRSFFQEHLPQFNTLLTDETLNTVAKKPSSLLPKFRYVSPTLHYKQRTAILGDCAHTVKPYFGLGANSALEDVQILGDCIEESDSIHEALQTFSKKRAKEVKTLVQISRSLDRPGFVGAFTFIIPIILDSIFQRLPFIGKLFKANTLALFQQPNMSFTGIRNRKRLDRFVQLSIIGSVLWGMSKIAIFGVRYICKLLNIPTKYVVWGMSLAVVGNYALKNIGSLRKDVSPADVMNKSKGTL